MFHYRFLIIELEKIYVEKFFHKQMVFNRLQAINFYENMLFKLDKLVSRCTLQTNPRKIC